MPRSVSWALIRDSQLEEAILSRQTTSRQTGVGPGGLLAAILVSTQAAPTPELELEMKRLSKLHGASVSCVHGADL